MSLFIDEVANAATVGEAFNSSEFINRNTLTTAGVLLGGSTVLASTALVAAAIPAQVLAASAASGALIYAGDRQHKGLPINPWAKSDEKSADKTETEQAAA